MKNYKTLFVTVNYKNWHETENLLNSVIKIKPKYFDLIVVDNDSDLSVPDNISSIIAKYNFNIVPAKTNLGYFGAIAFALKNISIEEYDFIIVCNNDIVIKDVNFFNKMYCQNKFEVIAPSIVNSDGIEQNPHRLNSASRIRRWFYRIYFTNYYLARILTHLVSYKKSFRKRRLRDTLAEEGEIFSPHGAFVIFKKNYFAKGGFIDDGFFLYGEEDSIAAISVKYEIKIGFMPSLKVLHNENSTTGKELSPFKFKCQKEARNYIRKEYPFINI